VFQNKKLPSSVGFETLFALHSFRDKMNFKGFQQGVFINSLLMVFVSLLLLKVRARGNQVITMLHRYLLEVSEEGEGDEEGHERHPVADTVDQIDLLAKLEQINSH
jgi:hypothetical protein